MKDSILNEKKKNTNSNLASRSFQGSIYEVPSKKYNYPLKDYKSKESIDPRVQNIDKINNKIRNIL